MEKGCLLNKNEDWSSNLQRLCKYLKMVVNFYSSSVTGGTSMRLAGTF